ncbi:hypothetical protein [Streptomyces sp. ITFR-16]|uniref:hypothetical protein n=1 Tax=Streptomyces sp. ITFR-16 TaxID=3075198 RepID=UPI00288AB2F2|nr:hypothetical protein [Streptomyces sp. ITFR-16]WNI25861.1 hypothetical protein RLT58_30050 [Streptomyces sp. ITFR-16]
MRKSLISLAVGATLTLSVPLGGTAYADAQGNSDWRYLTCTSGGARGELGYRWWSNGTIDSIDLELTALDISSDGHHPEVRFISHNYGGGVKYWSWHSYDGGAPGGRAWYTTAQSDAGLYSIGIQVANKEGSKIVTYKTCLVSEAA